MKKMTKIALFLITFALTVCAFAGGDALTACGVPQFIVDSLGFGSAGASFATILPLGEQQTGLVTAFKNGRLIADEVMPIKQLDGNELAFKYFRRNMGDAFGAQDTQVGRMSAPNVVYFGGEEIAGLAKAYGLQTPVPYEDLDQVKNKDRFVNKTIENLIDRILLDREIRIAKIVQDAANYESSQVKTLSASEKIGAEGSNIFELIMDMMESALVRPNVLGMSSKVFYKLRTDKSVINAIWPTNNGSGVATREQIADLFEVDRIIVGQARVNTRKNPKKPDLTSCWGENIFAHYQEELSDLKEGLAWGMTAQVGERYVEVIEDKKIGLKGGEIVKAGFYQAELVTAPGAGILLKDVLKTA